MDARVAKFVLAEVVTVAKAHIAELVGARKDVLDMYRKSPEGVDFVWLEEGVSYDLGMALAPLVRQGQLSQAAAANAEHACFCMVAGWLLTQFDVQPPTHIVIPHTEQ